jgi:hypothetical protein
MTGETHDGSRRRGSPPTKEAPCAQHSETERGAFLDGLKVQIKNGVYRPDVRDLARSLASMMVHKL